MHALVPPVVPPIDQPDKQPAPRRGRPKSPQAQSTAQRSKAYRDQQIAKGRTSVKCYLPPEAMAYLRALCDIHGVSTSEAIALALAAVMRGDLPIPH